MFSLILFWWRYITSSPIDLPHMWLKLDHSTDKYEVWIFNYREQAYFQLCSTIKVIGYDSLEAKKIPIYVKNKEEACRKVRWYCRRDLEKYFVKPYTININ